MSWYEEEARKSLDKFGVSVSADKTAKSKFVDCPIYDLTVRAQGKQVTVEMMVVVGPQGENTPSSQESLWIEMVTSIRRGGVSVDLWPRLFGEDAEDSPEGQEYARVCKALHDDLVCTFGNGQVDDWDLDSPSY